MTVAASAAVSASLPTAAAGEAHAEPQRHSLLLTVCCLAQFMVILDVSIVNVALPSIHASLGFSPTQLQWVVSAYTITFAGFLMLSGRAADLFGQRRTFVTGLLVFALASLLGGTALDRQVLVGARALQGLGGAIMAAASLAIITSSFAAGPERFRAIGLWGAMNGAGGATGTLLGGIITESLSWRWVLLINLPIGIAAALAARVVVAERRGRADAASFDLGGALAITGGLLALVYGIVNAGSEGWTAPAALGPIVLGLALLGLFVLIEGRLAAAPLVPLRVFASKPLRVANLVVLLFSASLFPMWYFTSLYLQEVLHMPPLGAGLTFLPMALTIMACATRAGALTARLGVRTVLGTGLVLMASGLLLFAARIAVNGSPIADVLLPGLLVSVGIGLSVVPATIAATAGARPGESGLASGLVNTSRQMGGALGLAILASLGAQFTSHLIDTSLQAPLVALTNGFRLAYLISALFVAAAAAVTFGYVPKLPIKAPAASAGAGGETPAPAQPAPAPGAAQEHPPASEQAAQEPTMVPQPQERPQPQEHPLPAPSPNGSVSAAAQTPAPRATSEPLVPAAAPAPPEDAAVPVRVQARIPVATVQFWLTGERRWPVASGSMTVRIAAGGGEHAGRRS
jgi:EmrB/QacA subfamily drug resistance transporter